MLYFAYGSNLNHRQMKHRCSGSKFIKKFTLKGYKLIFSHSNPKNKYGHANVQKKNGFNDKPLIEVKNSMHIDASSWQSI